MPAGVSMADLLENSILDDGVWMRVSELAKAKGVTRQSMSERVRKLETAGHLTTRKEGRSVYVNVPEFDFAVSRNGDAIAEQRINTRTSNLDESSPELRKSQARKAEYDAEMARLKLEREQGRVRDVSDIEQGAINIAIGLVAELDKLPAKANEIFSIAKNGNKRALKLLLRNIVNDTRSKMATDLQNLIEKEKTEIEQNMKDKNHG